MPFSIPWVDWVNAIDIKTGRNCLKCIQLQGDPILASVQFVRQDACHGGGGG
jgi:hypothetical protein